MKTKGVLGEHILNKTFTQTMLWTKIRDPRYLLIVLLAIDFSHVLVWTKKQTALLDQSDKRKQNIESWRKSRGNEPDRLDEATFGVDRTVNCDNRTLHEIQVDFTSTVVENGLFSSCYDTVHDRNIRFNNLLFTSF